MAALLQGEGAWIALGVSALFIVVGLVMHRIFINILKNGSQESPKHD
ncbi:hypothetical protein [Rhodoferax sp.]|nr:hypothetical protein [Rhodoferax sp.]MBT9508345.1 hypothetical protein [Rhodoferax sp.]